MTFFLKMKPLEKIVRKGENAGNQWAIGASATVKTCEII